MKISIITISYNGSGETIKLLESLKNQTRSTSSGQPEKDFEVIVIDNASEKEDFNSLEKYYNTNFDQTKGTFLIRNSQNLGFSEGNNIGISQALKNGSEWIVLLNNDTWVERDFVERLKAILEAKHGIVGIPLLESDQTAYYGKIKWLKPTLEHAYQLTSLPAYQLYAIGGAMAIHKDVFEKIGFLDEKYFLYFEDADFSVKARRSGFVISIAENLSVHHHISSTTKKLGSPLLLRYHYRNALYFNIKNGPWYIKLLVWPWSWVVIIKQFLKLVVGRNKKESRAILSGVIDFYRNKMGQIVDF